MYISNKDKAQNGFELIKSAVVEFVSDEHALENNGQIRNRYVAEHFELNVETETGTNDRLCWFVMKKLVDEGKLKKDHKFYVPDGVIVLASDPVMLPEIKARLGLNLLKEAVLDTIHKYPFIHNSTMSRKLGFGEKYGNWVTWIVAQMLIKEEMVYKLGSTAYVSSAWLANNSVDIKDICNTWNED